MNQYLKTFIKYTIWAFIFAGASYVYAYTYGVWEEPDPGCVPPDCNVVAPINAGDSSQTKTGFLWVQGIGSNAGGYFAGTLGVGVSSSTDPSAVGLTAVIGGSVGADEYCDTEGGNCVTAESIYNSVNSVDDGLSCPSTPNVTTMPGGPRITNYLANQDWDTGSVIYDYSTSGTVSSENYWNPYYIPAGTIASCRTEVGCVIKEKVYKRTSVSGTSPTQYVDKLYRIKTYSYIQAASGTTQTWTSSYSSGTNGNTTSTNIVNPISYLYLRDDAGSVETLTTAWSWYDNTPTYGREIYICTYTE